jgi:hypothetical protein
MALHFFRRLAGVVVGSACLMLWCTHAAAQTTDGGCGTVETDQSRRAMLGMMESGQWEEARLWLSGESATGVDAMVAMTMHVIRYDDGSEGLPQEQIDQCIVDLNSEVELTGLLFFQEGPTIYHDDSDLAESVYEDFCTIVNTGVVANTVNCYFIPVYEGLCGVASYPSSGCQGVTVANGCAATDWNHSTFTHEVGHYFNLRHTHSTSGGNECVDGSNCASAGDGFCDTPADPTLTGVVDWETCGYFGTEQDACGTGMQYDPDTTNIMSYSTKLCRTHLSTEQQSMLEWTALNNEHRTDELRYLGACCVETACSVTTASDCTGSWLGDGTTCSGDPCGAGSTVWTVDDDAGADFYYIQDAVDAALDGDEILVYPGTYTDTGAAVVDMMGKAVWLHSSDGPETTIIDGEHGRRGIVCSTNETSGTVIEGFTIRRGSTVNLLRGSFNNGAGMLCYFSSPVLTNCVFTENNTVSSGHNGGGLAIHGGSPSLTDCVIDSNTSYTAGGGIYTREASSFSLTNCTITNNTAYYGGGDDGGGIYNLDSIANLQDTVVCGNTPDQISGEWTDNGGNFVSDTCSGDPTGACCVDTSCSIETSADCSAAGGTYLGDGSSCSGDPCSAGNTTWTVDDDGGADFDNIQSAVDAALDGDEILVYPGTYTPADGASQVVEIENKALWLHSLEGPSSTIIDAGGTNRRAVHYRMIQTPGSVIEGFTITGANQTSGSWGAGLMVWNDGSVTSVLDIIDCIITGNTIGTAGSGSLSAGAGIQFGSGNYIISGCTISDNHCLSEDGHGGGVHAYNSTISISDCTISNNTVTDAGGGIFNYNNQNLYTITNSNICGNSPDQIGGSWTDGGGNYVADTCSGDPTGACCVDTSCSIETAANCSAAGGTYLGDGSSCSGDPCGAGSTVWTVDDDAGADFYYIQDAVDAALDGHEILVYPGTYTSTGDNVVDMMGKAVWLHSSDGPETTIIDGEGVRRGILSDSGETAKTMIEGFTIQNCYATPYAGWNNFRLGGGALIISSPTISNCIFDNNFAEYIKDGYGGGLFYGDTATQCDSVFTDCFFTNNTSDVVGGGVFGYNGTPEFVNCTIMGNTSYASGGGMYSGNDTPILTNCFITNNTAPYGGGIRSDNNLILFSTTVCGNTPDQIEGPWTDGGGNTVSDECPPDCPDVDGDGMVNVNDLLIVIAAWGLNGPLGDVNQDGIVGVNDLLIVIANWGPCP